MERKGEYRKRESVGADDCECRKWGYQGLQRLQSSADQAEPSSGV